MSLTTATADGALKDDYQPLIREQLTDINVVLSQVEKNSEDTEGTEAVLSLHVSRNSGVGARAEGGTLPTAGSQGYTNERVPLRRNYGRIQVSGPVIRAMKSNKGSWTRAIESESKGIVRDLKRDVNRQANGTSDGVIAATGVTAGSTTVVLSEDIGDNQLRQLAKGDRIDIGTVANPTSVASNRTILSVDRAAGTITISGAAVTTSADDRIFRQGAGGAGANQVELTGLQTIVNDSGVLHNVDPAVYDVWVSYVDDNDGVDRAPTDTLFERAIDETEIASGEVPGLVVTTHGVARNYAAGLKALKRFTNTVDLKGGFKGLSIDTAVGQVVLTTERDAPKGQAAGINLSHITQFESSDWEFMDEDGAVLNRVPDKDAYEATLFKYHEVCTDQRNAHFRIRDLTEA